ncbi:copper homeostasis protein CutC [Ligilactobacillus araffinosus]|uniref:Copper homeostasis protein cutC homolog n=1 Tax=Ligilactobacillus araffinosus DSM 20653 TaxID=1423820 RepID=A0A0R1ZBJ3_9LACO|nr:copper homeostasis protein CutC [Ligilactobacillus araffinosus]KRM51685.1 CutC family copper homeostasis protein [Ligilactobacillus araffinosus DSM 20653]
MIIKQKTVQTIHELSTLTDFQKIELQNQQTTASKGMIAETVRYLHDNQKISIETLIRPRTGKYSYSDIEIKIMEADVFEAQALGVDSVAIGAITEENHLDEDSMTQLIGAAGGMQITLNHAFDELTLAGQKKAIDFANEHGIDRIMISVHPDSSSFKKNLQTLIAYNQGTVQFVLTGKDEKQLTELCEQFNLHLLLVE